MKTIYHVWMDTNSRVRYTIGYFEDKEDAEKHMPSMAATEPPAGISEIYVYTKEDIKKLREGA